MTPMKAMNTATKTEAEASAAAGTTDENAGAGMASEAISGGGEFHLSEGNTNDAAAMGALNIALRPSDTAAAAMPGREALAPGIAPTAAHDLLPRGGKTIRNLSYINLYVGGQAAWVASDRQNIDRALNAIMTDTRLNNVLTQYFNNQSVGTTTAPSIMLPGPKPNVVSRTSIDALVKKHVVASGLLNRFDPATTVFNFLLPRGTVLTTDGGVGGAHRSDSDETETAGAASGAAAADVTTVTTIRSGNAVTTITVSTTTENTGGVKGGGGEGDDSGGGDNPLGGDPDDAASSLNGLGGYHGSVHIANTVVYFSVDVFSERLSNGTENGIAAFSTPWKNVVATLYHELQEARTDPDVEDAIRTNNLHFIGWNSRQGEEIGDFPVFEANPLQRVFKEVPLLAGGVAPIQLMYSNRVHGPEDPTI